VFIGLRVRADVRLRLDGDVAPPERMVFNLLEAMKAFEKREKTA
jgi:hypothetical protein